MNMPGDEYIAVTMRSGVPGFASAAAASSPATRPRSIWPASSSGTFSVLPLVFLGWMRSAGSCAFTISLKASPNTGKPPPGVAVPRTSVCCAAEVPMVKSSPVKRNSRRMRLSYATMTADEILQREFAALPELVRAHAGERPRSKALVQDGRSLDYAGLDALMDRIAASLQRDGVAPRDAVAICAPTSIEYSAVFLGALRAGAAVAPISPSGTPGSIEAMVRDSASKLFFDETRLRNLDAWLANAVPAPVGIEPDWPFNIIYSSGTTGTPKGIVHPHRMRWVHIRRAASLGYGPDAVTLLSTPLYSNTTLVSFLPTVALGGTAILMAKFDVRGYLELAQAHRVTHTILV